MEALNRPREFRSVEIPKETLEAFGAWVASCRTKYDAHIISGLNRNLIDSVLLKGTCKPSTLAKIEALLNSLTQPA